METPAPHIPDGKVFDWLGSDARNVPYYLHPLNLVWSDAGVEQDLQIYRRVAVLLAGEPAYWAEIIRAASWRHCLAGCACLLASRRQDYFDDLCFRFRAGSFVAPQIAVTLGLLHCVAARPFFESVLGDPALRQNAKLAVSAHRVLLCLRAQPLHEILLDSWTGLGRDNAMLSDQIVAAQWDFWSGRI